MARYTVTKALRGFSELLDRALAGEEVVITRRGVAIVRIDPVKTTGKAPLSLEWLIANRVARDED